MKYILCITILILLVLSGVLFYRATEAYERGYKDGYQVPHKSIVIQGDEVVDTSKKEIAGSAKVGLKLVYVKDTTGTDEFLPYIPIDTLINGKGISIRLYSENVATKPIEINWSILENTITKYRVDTLKEFIEVPIPAEITFWDKAKYVTYGAVGAVGAIGTYILIKGNR